MENNYRDMMDEVRAPEGLRGSVMDMTERERTKKTRPAPARVLMAAACICALLAVGAVAVAEMVGIQVGPILPGDELPLDPSKNPEDYSGYTIIHDGGFSWDRVSAELKAEAKENMREGIYTAYFGSQAELEAALGFTLPYNSFLAAAQESEGRYGLPGSLPGTKEVIHIFGQLLLVGNEETLSWLSADTNYAISNPEHVAHTVDLPISEEERKDGVVSSYTTCMGEVSVSVNYEGRESEMSGTITYLYENFELTREDYVTPNGVQTVIIREDSKTPALIEFDEGLIEFDEGYQSYTAYLTVDGMMLSVHVHGNENCTDVKGVLKSILDAYQ